MGDKRKGIKDMFDAVERGDTYTVKRKGVPVAVVVPHLTWLEMNRRLGDLGRVEQGVPPMPPELIDHMRGTLAERGGK